MAETGIAIRLSLKDAEVVARALEQVGGQGERALKRIEAAARSLGHEAPATFRAMEVAAESAKGKFEEFGHHAGTLGRMLEQFGPLGLGAAAGVGAMTLAFDRLVEGARESFEQLHRLETSAERLGVGTSALQELHFAFG